MGVKQATFDLLTKHGNRGFAPGGVNGGLKSGRPCTEDDHINDPVFLHTSSPFFEHHFDTVRQGCQALTLW
jgi:hypothetical protein